MNKSAKRLIKVTVTGADEQTSPEVLSDLCQWYPQLELAFLFSNMDKVVPRYPSFSWIVEACGMLPQHQTAIHLCGKQSREMLFGDSPHSTDSAYLLKCIDRSAARVQLNYGVGYSYPANFRAKLISPLNPVKHRTTILQGEPETLESLGLLDYRDVQVLFDRSGGRGTLPAAWPQAPKLLTDGEEYMHRPYGYAGGLNPDNISTELPKIAQASGNRLFWIDVETGVRTVNDEFSIAKVVDFLEEVEKWQRGEDAGDRKEEAVCGADDCDHGAAI